MSSTRLGRTGNAARMRRSVRHLHSFSALRLARCGTVGQLTTRMSGRPRRGIFMRFRTVAVSAALVLCATAGGAACSSSSDTADATRPEGPAASTTPVPVDGMAGYVETGERRATRPRRTDGSGRALRSARCPPPRSPRSAPSISRSTTSPRGNRPQGLPCGDFGTKEGRAHAGAPAPPAVPAACPSRVHHPHHGAPASQEPLPSVTVIS